MVNIFCDDTVIFNPSWVLGVTEYVTEYVIGKMLPKDFFTSMSVWVPSITKKSFRPKSTGPCQGGPLKLGARTPPSEIVYLGLGRELRVNVVLQNDHKHHISGYASRFQSSGTFSFRVMGQNVSDGHRGGSKIRNFQTFRIMSCLVST